jgi:hypothetical protein
VITTRPSRLRRIVICSALAVGVAACSSDKKSASTTTATLPAADSAAIRATVVSFTLQQGTLLGYVLDVDCVTKIVAQLSDADAALLASGTVDTSPDATTPALSAAGEALGARIDECAIGSNDTDLVAAAVEKVMSSPGGVDLDLVCVEDAFSKLSDAQLHVVVESATDSTDARLQPIGVALFPCLKNAATTTTT